MPRRSPGQKRRSLTGEARSGLAIRAFAVPAFPSAHGSTIMRGPHDGPAKRTMAQYIYTMNRVSRVVPPKRVILRDISLSFFPGAKIGVLGLNGAGKSSLLRI